MRQEKPKVNPHVILREEDFGGILFCRETGFISEINITGVRILKLCNGLNSIETIINAIAQEFEIEPRIIQNDIVEFIKRLEALKLINSEEPPQPLPHIHLFEQDISTIHFKTLSAPLAITWEMTYKCNLRCFHCYTLSSNPLKNELTTDEALTFIDELSEMKVFLIAFGGGEPLERKDFFEIARYANQQGLITSLATNGTLINDRVAQTLKEVGINNVQVSLDGFKSAHERIRGKGTYARSLKGIKALLRAGINVTVATVVTKINFHEVLDLIDFIGRVGVKKFRVLRLIPTGRAKENMEKLQLSSQQLKEFSMKLLKKKQELEGKIEISNPPFRFLIDKEYLKFLKNLRKGNEIVGCAAGRSLCNIKPNGIVTPCSFLDSTQFIAGNIRQQSFKEIWKNSEVFRFIRNLNKLEGKCRSCKHLKIGICGGGCRGAAFTFYKSIYAPDPHCFLE